MGHSRKTEEFLGPGWGGSWGGVVGGVWVGWVVGSGAGVWWWLGWSGWGGGSVWSSGGWGLDADGQGTSCKRFQEGSVWRGKNHQCSGAIYVWVFTFKTIV